MPTLRLVGVTHEARELLKEASVALLIWVACGYLSHSWDKQAIWLLFVNVETDRRILTWPNISLGMVG